MRSKKELKRFFRAILKKELRNMDYQLEQHLKRADLLNHSLRADIPQWGVFKAHLEYVGKPTTDERELECYLESAARYLERPQEHLRPTEPIEYLQVACMYIDSITTLEKYIKGRRCYCHFSSMEDLFPGWDAMMEVYREAIYQLLIRTDEGYAALWKAGCVTLEQLQYWAEQFSKS